VFFEIWIFNLSLKFLSVYGFILKVCYNSYCSPSLGVNRVGHPRSRSWKHLQLW